MENMYKKLNTEAVLLVEGGAWLDFESFARSHAAEWKRVHAIKFIDGSVWDAQNGWREYKLVPTSERSARFLGL